MSISCSTCLLGFSVKYFFHPIYTDYAFFYIKKITLKSSASESFAEMNLGYTLSKLCVTSTLHSRRLPLEISLN